MSYGSVEAQYNAIGTIATLATLTTVYTGNAWIGRGLYLKNVTLDVRYAVSSDGTGNRCQLTIETSQDGTNFQQLGNISAGTNINDAIAVPYRVPGIDVTTTANSTTYTAQFTIEKAAEYIRISARENGSAVDAARGGAVAGTAYVSVTFSNI